MARKTHRMRPTLLAVGEGDSEGAFLKHLRALYCSGGVGVTATVRNAHGKGPKHVIDFTSRQARAYSYDRVVALLDTDNPWTGTLLKTARRGKIVMVGSRPCLEGFLLSIQGKQPPEQTAACKKAIAQSLGIDLTEAEGYARHFPKAMLEDARARLPELDSLIRCFEGD